jgi:predicted nucleic acid-binding protein
MSFLLDTDVLSQPSKAIPNAAAIDWIARNDAGRMYLSVVSLAEVRAGIGGVPAGKRRTALAEWLDTVLVPHFHGRILPVTEEIAYECGDLIANCRRAGYSVQAMDALVAATAKVHRLSVVTLNRKHFIQLGVPVVTL